MVYQLPASVRFARRDQAWGSAVTFKSPTNEETAVFDATGMLLGSVTPGIAYMSNLEQELYSRVVVSFVGTVTCESWNGTGWE